MRSTIITGIALCIVTAFCSCQNNSATVSPANDNDLIPIESVAFKTAGGWGYTITVDNKIFIKQSTIPVIEGNKSFATEQDAVKVASLVVDKIKTHQKATIFKAELQKLGIIE